MKNNAVDEQDLLRNLYATMGRWVGKGDGWVAAAADLQDNVVDELQLEEAPLQPKSKVDEQRPP